MNKPKFLPETAFYCIAFLIALGIRLASLGGSALTDPEAAWALQALHLSQGLHPDIGGQPSLMLFTGSLFFVFGSSEFLARLVPAIVGSFLVFAPNLFSDRIGKAAAVGLAFALALDPGLVAMSRQVDGRILALTFTILSIGFWNKKIPAGAGIFAGLALLGGISFWLGAVILLLTGLIYIAFQRRNTAGASLMGIEPDVSSSSQPHFLRSVLFWFAGTIVVAGTLFFLEPKGLSAVAVSLVAFLQGFSGAGGVPIIEVLGGLVFYEIFPLALAIIATVRAVVKKDGTDELLALAWLIALAVVMLNPGRQVGDLVWVAVPMWALGVRYLVTSFGPPMPFKQVFGEAILTIVILVSAWLNFIAAIGQQFNDPTAYILWIVFMIFFLGIALILLTWGWGLNVALRGMGLGACVLLVVFTLSAAWKGTGQESRPEQELWLTGSNFHEAGLLLKTANEYSLWNTGNPNGMDLTVVNGSPSLQWLFRNFTQTSFLDSLQADSNPSMVVTSDQKTISLAGAYTGQSFVLQESPNWTTLTAADWINWMVFRQAPLAQIKTVLWVRSNLFPGSSNFGQNPTP